MSLKKIITASLLACIGLLSGACSNSRNLPMVFMPDPPAECEKVMNQSVDPLPAGKSNAAKLAVDMAKEGAARTKEQQDAKVCAEYALRTAGVMKDGDRKPASGEAKVASASKVPTSRVK